MNTSIDKRKRSRWFPMDRVNPVRRGLYEVRTKKYHFVITRYWCGVAWRMPHPYKGERVRVISLINDDRPGNCWRGLAEKP